MTFELSIFLECLVSLNPALNTFFVQLFFFEDIVLLHCKLMACLLVRLGGTSCYLDQLESGKVVAIGLQEGLRSGSMQIDLAVFDSCKIASSPPGTLLIFARHSRGGPNRSSGLPLEFSLLAGGRFLSSRSSGLL